MSLVHAFVITLTPEAVSMIQALDGETETSDEAVLEDLTGSGAGSGRILTIAEAMSAGGLDMLDQLREQMEIGATNPSTLID